MLRQTREKIARIEKEAYARGYQKGEEDAWKTWEKARGDFHTTTVSILDGLEKLREDIYRETEADLIDLAVKMAEKLVCRQLDVWPDTIIDIVKEACNQARDCKEIVQYVPARQLESIIAKQGERDAQLYKTEHFAIRSDPNLKYGGCRIETEQGYIDASVETMKEQLSRLFKDDSK
jgi:flagellar assembly protein FliH